MAKIIKPLAKVISFPNDFGRNQLDSFFKQKGNAAKTQVNALMQFNFLLSAFDFMQFVEQDKLPTGDPEEKPFKTELTVKVDGEEYTKSFELVKKLQKDNIYELRLDFDPPPFYWRLRIIFFPYDHNGDLFYCMVFPIEKILAVRVNLTDIFRDRAEGIYYDLINNPGKYAHCFK
jgi:hypothetical protein